MDRNKLYEMIYRRVEDNSEQLDLLNIHGEDKDEQLFERHLDKVLKFDCNPDGRNIEVVNEYLNKHE